MVKRAVECHDKCNIACDGKRGSSGIVKGTEECHCKSRIECDGKSGSRVMVKEPVKYHG